jgi:signal transduction histidine kinase
LESELAKSAFATRRRRWRNSYATLEQRVIERTNQLLEAVDALRQSQKTEAIGQLTGGIAHEFNNLLQGIVGALNMVQKRMTEGRISEVERFLQGAVSSAERASTLTNRLLAFSRCQPIDPRPIDVNALVGSIEEFVRRSLGEGVKMVISGADDLWLTRCDANQLKNAILNLAINARDAMPDGGTLTIPP